MNMKRYFIRAAAAALIAVMLLMMCSCAYIPGWITSGSDAEVEDDTPATETPDESEAEPEKEFGEYDMTLEKLINQLNLEREMFSKEPSIDVEQFLPDYTSPDFIADEFTEEEMDRLAFIPDGYPDKISFDQALEDIDILFRILRTSYGGYTFFGGDEVFGAVKAKLIERLEKDFRLGITPLAFRSLLASALEFVEDNHFHLGWEGLEVSEQYTYQDKYGNHFRLDENGYYTLFDEDDTRWYIAPEDEEWLRLTIADDGELVYGLFTFEEMYKTTSLRKEFTLTDGQGNKRDYTANWKMIGARVNTYTDCYDRYELDGVQVMRLSTFYFDKENAEECNTYINEAKILARQNVFVVDLRGNGGGYAYLNGLWLENLTGNSYIADGLGSVYYASTLNARMELKSEQNFFDDLGNIDAIGGGQGTQGADGSIMAGYTDTAVTAQGEVEVYEQWRAFHPYDGTIFVLFDKETSSAGEIAIMQLRSMSNVVLVGTNSSGCLQTGNINSQMPVHLPNSAIYIGYGANLMVIDEMESSFDTTGIMPDIFVSKETALQDIIDCWNYYN